MAPTTEPTLPVTDYLKNELHVGDDISFIGQRVMGEGVRLYKGKILVLDGTNLCVQSGGLKVLKGETFKNPDKVVYLGVALVSRPEKPA
ncbi:hypothetical protein PV382_17985 [Streptomyces scabiei]|uniref:hypothetical protein n=1 Tax=Streptomyces scabiei TaxID=1930 RepID=UPI0007661C65|nr:hypothetical protein [Streptomyces scabiei]MDX2996399.1 hypothetical protein [Streptomyces scabiei]MDX3049890.1 hypothetical protein [Streptomyces scabiei]MDX3174167.1 hypothetical protein [Streptomyces scabiei]